MHNAFLFLKTYCESENFKGWDPYDGLNSKVFQALPFKHWDLGRAIWIQIFKHSPINFRRLLLVPKEHNAKGVALGPAKNKIKEEIPNTNIEGIN